DVLFLCRIGIPEQSPPPALVTLGRVRLDSMMHTFGLPTTQPDREHKERGRNRKEWGQVRRFVAGSGRLPTLSRPLPGASNRNTSTPFPEWSHCPGSSAASFNRSFRTCGTQKGDSTKASYGGRRPCRIVWV